MDSIKINLNTLKNNYFNLSVDSANKIDGGMSVVLNNNCGYSISSGDTILVSKFVEDKSMDGMVKYAEKRLTVISGGSLSNIILSEPVLDTYNIESHSDKIFESNGNKYYFIKLEKNHGYTVTDIEAIYNFINRDEVSMDYLGGTLQDLNSGYTYSIDRVELVYDEFDTPFVMCRGTEQFANAISGPQYILSGISKTGIFIKVSDEEGNITVPIESLDNALFSFNHNNLYAVDGNKNIHFYDSPDKRAYTSFTKEVTRNIPIGLSSDDCHKNLMSELFLVDKFQGEMRNDIVPDFVDMEKFKYEPCVKIDESNETTELATELKFILHFRDRVKVSEGTVESWPNSAVSFADGWYVDSGTCKWNNISPNYDTNNGKFKNSDSGYTKNDLIGYLDFSDDDIRYQKTKVKKTFLRLSFYTTNNPLTQSLLAYSTMFLDAGTLYGKYMKLSFDEDAIKAKNNGIPFVRYSGNGITNEDKVLYLDFSVKSEFDDERSSDGFYLYLFGDDAPQENVSRTIYMKVEFNHAGKGRSIPMLNWKFDSTTGESEYLDMSNYLDFLYIPVNIWYINGKYVYNIPDANNENGIITLNLLEPNFKPLNKEITN